MQIASFRYEGRDTFGVVSGERVVDAHPLLDGAYDDLRAVISGGMLNALAAAAENAVPDIPLAEVEFHPVIAAPERIVCIGLNYMNHIKEMGREVPEKPSLFLKMASALVGHGQPIVKPRISDAFDFEGELAVIIGKPGRYISEDAALDFVAGYTILNDGSVRDWQRDNVCAGKNFPRTSGFGPWIVTTDAFGDPGNVTVETRLNGDVVQHDSTAGFLFTVPRLINYVSTFTDLAPGDVISTGTPAGVGAGRTPPLWMKPGDVVEVEISGIGTLRNEVVAEA